MCDKGSLSISEREEAEKRLKLPKFKKANIALVILEPKMEC